MKKETISWSKILLILLFINFFALEFFICGITLYSLSIATTLAMMPDFTPLITLIGAVIGQTISYGIYIAKSKAENTKDGIIYETAMYNLQQNQVESEEEDHG